MKHLILAFSAVAFAFGASAELARAQSTSSPSVSPKTPNSIVVRSLAPVAATSQETFGAILGVRQLGSGRVLVNDGKLRRLLVLDSALRTLRVALDSASGIANGYGPRAQPIVPYLGDSTLFFDGESRTLVLVDPTGAVTRVMSPPNDPAFALAVATSPGVDDRGRILFKGSQSRRPPPGTGGGLTIQMLGSGIAPITNADSQPVIRGDFETRRVDTVAHLRNLHGQRSSQAYDAVGNTTMTVQIDPLRTGDEFTVLSDGTIAIVRGHDYHIDWIAPDGTKSSSEKLPFDWKRLTDAEKTKVRDSAVAALAAEDSVQQVMRRQAAGGAPVASGGSGAGGVARAGRGGGDGDGAPPPVRFTRVKTIAPISEMEDFVPPLRSGSLRPDLDGNLWILPATSAQSLAGELVYDVVNRQGILFQRVRLPVGRSIVGFGKGGVVYLMRGDLKTGFQLERTRVVVGASK